MEATRATSGLQLPDTSLSPKDAVASLGTKRHSNFVTAAPYRHSPALNTKSNIDLKANPGERDRSPRRYEKYTFDESRASDASPSQNANFNTFRKKNRQMNIAFKDQPNEGVPAHSVSNEHLSAAREEASPLGKDASFP